MNGRREEFAHGLALREEYRYVLLNLERLKDILNFAKKD